MLDNPNSLQLNTGAGYIAAPPVPVASQSGNGFANNKAVSGSTVPGTQFQQGLQTTYQNSGCINTCLSERLSRNVDASKAATNASSQNLYGTGAGFIMSATQLSQEFKPYTVVNNNCIIQYDVAVLRLRDLYESIAVFPLCKKLELSLRVFVNTGSIQVDLTTPNSKTLGYFSQLSQSTFTNTIPFVIPYLPGTSANGGIVTAATRIVSSLCIARTATTSIGGINLAVGAGSHALPSCRIYYPSIQ